MVAVATDSEKMVPKVEETEARNVEQSTVKITGAEFNKFWFRILPQLSSAFFCLSLRTGTMVIGWFFTVLTLITAVLFGGSAIFFAIYACVAEFVDGMRSVETDKMVENFGIAVLTSPFATVSIMLLVGLYKRKVSLLKPFIVVLYAAIVLEMYLRLTPTFYRLTSYFFFSNFSRFVFEIYSLLVVNSYYRELKSQSFSSQPQLQV